MGKRPILLQFCHRCRACHPEGEHLAKPKRDAVEDAVRKVSAPRRKSEMAAGSLHEPGTDGVALKSTVHPRGRKKVPRDISAASIETVAAPPEVVAEVERLGPKEIKKRKAAKKKRNKAEVQELVDAEMERKRALKSARQARWRAGKKKPKRKGKK